MPSRLPSPIQRAMTTFAPKEMPINKLRTDAIIGTLLPTAAIASLPTNCPSIAVSAALNNCCIIPVIAKGKATINILSHKDPDNIFTCLSLRRDCKVFIESIIPHVVYSKSRKTILENIFLDGRTFPHILNSPIPAVAEHKNNLSVKPHSDSS